MKANAKHNIYDDYYELTKMNIARYKNRYSNCSLYIASLNNSVFEIFLEEHRIYAGDKAECTRIFNHIIKCLKQAKYTVEKADGEYYNIKCF